MNRQRIHLLINLALFQLVWFACIFGGNLAAVLMTPLLLGWHLRQLKPREWPLLLLFTGGGALLDSLLLASGQLRLAGASTDWWPHWLLPYWLLLLWLAFATTLLHSLAWLMQRPLVASLAAAVFAPLSYWSGAQLSGASISPAGLAIIALQWTLLIALTSRIIARMSWFSHKPAL